MFFIPPMAYYGGVAALGAGAKFLNANPGIVRAGQKFVNKLPNYAQAIQNRLFSTQAGVPISTATKTGGKITSPGSIASAIGPAYTMSNVETAHREGLGAAGQEIKNMAMLPYDIPKKLKEIYIDDTETGQNIKNKILSIYESIVDKKANASETKKSDEKSDDGWNIDDLPLDAEEAKKKKKKKKKDKKDSKEAVKNLHKGGYVKKQRKRKPYKSSGFVKMKKSKKRKYI